MEVRYYRRFLMEIDLRGELAQPSLPEGYFWTPWSERTLTRHASTKYVSFRDEIDADVFECFREYDGCLRLMKEITAKTRFVPNATWLISYQPKPEFPNGKTVRREDCATIQGVMKTGTLGAIQNVGVIPAHRSVGLGRALVLQALRGFQEAGYQQASLQVTASNAAAVSLYRSIGFRLTRTMFKAVEVEPLAV